MIHPWKSRRFVPVLTLAGLMAVSVSYGQETWSKDSALAQNGEESALVIVDKKYDEESGDLVLVLTNRSEVSVTAFSLFFVIADATGNGPIHFTERDFFPGDGIAPGAAHPITVNRGIPDQPSSRFSARSVRLDFEIRSDNSSYGNAASVDRVFERRVADYVELNGLLTRIKQMSSGLPMSLLPMLKEVAERGQEARGSLLQGSNPQTTERERAHLAALSGTGFLAEQTLAMVEKGLLPEQAVARLEKLLEVEVARRSKGFRSVDLERYDR